MNAKESEAKVREMFDVTRHCILRRMGEIDLGKSWSWIEGEVERMARAPITVEYETTSVGLFHVDHETGRTTDAPVCKRLEPQRPKGEGWDMCGSAANDHHLFWFWKRTP